MIIQGEISNLKNGKYGLDFNGYLFFDGEIKITPEQSEFSGTQIVVDKKSALQIAYTLFDSMGMLNNQTEKLLEQIEERIIE